MRMIESSHGALLMGQGGEKHVMRGRERVQLLFATSSALSVVRMPSLGWRAGWLVGELEKLFCNAVIADPLLDSPKLLGMRSMQVSECNSVYRERASHASR